MPRLAWNAIVKNEGERIVRAMASVTPHICAAVITDTGSTDNTKEIIRKYMADLDIPLVLTDAPFEDWSQARNEALRSGRAHAKRLGYDYLLLMDADMELVVNDATAFDALKDGGLSYDMFQKTGTMSYINRRLVKVDSVGEYRGVTHEYLDVAAAGCIPFEKAMFNDHCDGANRPEKYKRDIRLLKAGLKQEPNNERYFFYLAQSYRDAGDLKNAVKWYRRRVKAGGWDEERWYAQFSLAMCLLSDKQEAGFICEMLSAYDMRPSRGESLLALANFYRHKSMNAASVLFSEEGMKVKRPDDALFIDEYAHGLGPKEEFSICGFYLPRKREKAFVVANELSLLGGPEAHNARELARRNMYWYLPTLKEHCPSFTWRKINWTPPKGWTALNPSVAMVGGRIQAIIRTVNYRMDEEGRYLINGTDGTANDSNPINTRNWRADFGYDPMSETARRVFELLPPGNLPVRYPLVVGYEDMRLIPRGRGVYVSATMRQLAADGWCEQVYAEIGEQSVGEPYVMRKQPRANEKNWMPIIGRDVEGKQLFMYRLGHVIKTTGDTVVRHDTKVDVEAISGGSQVIAYQGGYLCIVHEAKPLPDKPWKRYYWHRFVLFGADFSIQQISLPFVFHDKVIEFCAGLTYHPDGNRLVISYGQEDKEARFATVDHREVTKFLLRSQQ